MALKMYLNTLTQQNQDLQSSLQLKIFVQQKNDLICITEIGEFPAKIKAVSICILAVILCNVVLLKKSIMNV